jgi:hypothetical protein
MGSPAGNEGEDADADGDGDGDGDEVSTPLEKRGKMPVAIELLLTGAPGSCFSGYPADDRLILTPLSASPPLV